MHSLPRLPTGALLTSCGRSRETVVKNYHPSLVCFWRSSTFLGISGDLDPDLIWPHLVVGSSLGLFAVLNRILCYLSLGVHLVGALWALWRLFFFFELPGPCVGPYFVFPSFDPTLKSFPCSVEILRPPSLTY